MSNRRIPTALAIAITTAEELHRMLERLVLNDSYQRGWVYWQAYMLEHWGKLAAEEEPHCVILAEQLTRFARRIQIGVVHHVR